jgi:hypothetical protein
MNESQSIAARSSSSVSAAEAARRTRKLQKSSSHSRHSITDNNHAPTTKTYDAPTDQSLTSRDERNEQSNASYSFQEYWEARFVGFKGEIRAEISDKINTLHRWTIGIIVASAISLVIALFSWIYISKSLDERIEQHIRVYLDNLDYQLKTIQQDIIQIKDDNNSKRNDGRD